METEKVTVMILDVDLKCSCCYKKVKKVLCKFPQIRNQVFDVDKNKVIITVVCCDPEKIRDKLCCKGGNAIQSIEIVENKPPKQIKKINPSENTNTPTSEPNSPPAPMRERPQPFCRPASPVSACCQECYEGHGGGPCHYGSGRAVPPPPGPCYGGKKPSEKINKPTSEPNSPPAPMRGHPQPFCRPAFPVSACCQECYEGRGGGPCHYGYGRAVPPPPGPCYGGYGYRPCYVSRCDCFSEENPEGCSIM